MSNDVKPFGSIERAVVAALQSRFAVLPDLWPDADAPGRVGGDLAYEKVDGSWYVRVDRVGSSTGRFEGAFTIDIEVFGVNYLDVESRSLDIEAFLLGYPHVVEVGDERWVFDTVSQNAGPDELPWEDDEVSRLGATYVITARRR